jgi:tRNA(Ile)-lysidine synthetase-like protein
VTTAFTSVPSPVTGPAGPLIDAVAGALRRSGLCDTTVIVAVSGGADSLAMLLALVALQAELGLQLQVAHVDHRLRPDSGKDAQFVAELAASLGLGCVIGTADVAGAAAEGDQGIEAAAREARYAFLAEQVRATGAAAAVVGHTRDDQLETRLLHLLRGSGLRGLTGMTEDSTLSLARGASVRVVRPLLRVTRAATEEFCRARGVVPLQDPSNADWRFTRNRLRQAVVPALRAINPQVDRALEALGRAAADAEALVQDELDWHLAALAAEGALRQTPEAWSIDRDRWRSLPSALRRALLRRAADAIALGGPEREGSREDVGATAIEAALAAAETGPAGKRLAWSGQRELRVEHQTITVARSGAAAMAPVQSTSIHLPVDSSSDRTIDLGYLPAALVEPLAPTRAAPRRATLTVRRRERACSPGTGGRWHCDLNLAGLGEEPTLIVRGWQPGDRLAPEGMGGHRKVQDLLVDGHLPRADRPAVPLVATPAGLAWVIGLRRDRRAQATADSTAVACLTVTLAAE